LEDLLIMRLFHFGHWLYQVGLEPTMTFVTRSLCSLPGTSKCLFLFRTRTADVSTSPGYSSIINVYDIYISEEGFWKTLNTFWCYRIRTYLNQCSLSGTSENLKLTTELELISSKAAIRNSIQLEIPPKLFLISRKKWKTLFYMLFQLSYHPNGVG